MKTPDPETASLEELLAHSGWVQALAKSLLADEHQAEDVSQQTLMVALERQPHGGAGLQAWLTRVARGIALNLRRGERRRLAREEKVAQTTAMAATSDEIVAWAERMHEVALAVSSLDEPHKGIIVQRYFDGLPLHEIASRLGMPASTVRSHLRRGLQKLKLEMQTRLGKDGYLAGLAILASPISGTAVLATSGSISFTTWITHLLLMSTKTKLAFSAALLLLISWAVWPTPELDTLENNTIEVSMPAAELDVNVNAERVDTPGGLSSANRVELEDALDTKKASFSITVVDQSGNPIPDAQIQAKYVHPDWKKSMTPQGWFGWFNAEPDIVFAKSNKSGQSKSTGIAAGDPLVIYAHKDGYAIAGKMHLPILGSIEQDCGELELAPGGNINVRVVDSEDTPVENATVSLLADPVEPVGTLYFQTGKANQGGEISFPNSLIQLHQLKVTAPGFLTKELEGYQPNPSKDYWNHVTLERGFSIRGLVLEADRSPAVDTPIYVIRKGHTAFNRPHRFDRGTVLVRADAKGHFEITGLEDLNSEYQIIARRSSTVWAATDLIKAGSEVSISLPGYHNVRGKILLADKSHASHAAIGFVNVAYPGHETEIFRAADKDGSFQFSLADGKYGAMAKNSLGRTILDPFEVNADVDLGEIVLTAGVPLTVTTLSSLDQTPIPFPHHGLKMGAYPNYEKVVIGSDTWRERIKFEASARRFDWDQLVEDHVAIIRYLPEGQHDLVTIATGFVQKYTAIDLKQGNPQEVTIYLDPTSKLNLTIKDHDGSPIADQNFSVGSIPSENNPDAYPVGERSTTNSAGVAIFNRITPGKYRLSHIRGAHPGFNNMTTLLIEPGENSLEFTYPIRTDFQVQIFDQFGPASEVQVILRASESDGYSPQRMAISDAKGIATFEQLWPGSYNLDVSRNGSPSIRQSVQLSGESAEVELQFEGVEIKGEIPAENFDLMPNVTVILSGYPLPPSEVERANIQELRKQRLASSVHGASTPDESGEFKFMNVRPGIYRISMYAQGHLSSEQTIVRVYQNSIDGIQPLPLVPESKILLKINGLEEYVKSNPADLFYAKIYHEPNTWPDTRDFHGDCEKEFSGLKQGSYSIQIYSVTLPGKKETLVDTIPVQVGEPGTVTTARWPK